MELDKNQQKHRPIAKATFELPAIVSDTQDNDANGQPMNEPLRRPNFLPHKRQAVCEQFHIASIITRF